MQDSTNQNPWSDWQLISVYTRAQALADGSLVDASELARSAGFRLPVAVTAAAWADCIEWDQSRDGPGQDERGRLWDVLLLANVAARRCVRMARATLDLRRVPRGQELPELVELEMVIGPGDTPAPVLTIQFPGED